MNTKIKEYLSALKGDASFQSQPGYVTTEIIQKGHSYQGEVVMRDKEAYVFIRF